MRSSKEPLLEDIINLDDTVELEADIEPLASNITVSTIPPVEASNIQAEETHPAEIEEGEKEEEEPEEEIDPFPLSRPPSDGKYFYLSFNFCYMFFI